MSKTGEAPHFDPIRSPETPQEKWGEIIRLAASVVDNAGDELLRKKTSNKDRRLPTYLEAIWKDYESGERFNLQRYSEQVYPGSGKFVHEYFLKVYFVDTPDATKPDIEFSFYADRASLKMVDGNSNYVDLDKWCRDWGVDKEEPYEDLYHYMLSSSRDPLVQLPVVRYSAPDGDEKLIDYRQASAAFGQIILGEAVEVSRPRIDRVRQFRSYNLMDKSNEIAHLVAAGNLGRGLHRSDVYKKPDIGPGNWRLSRQALASAIAAEIFGSNIGKVPGGTDVPAGDEPPHR